MANPLEITVELNRLERFKEQAKYYEGKPSYEQLHIRALNLIASQEKFINNLNKKQFIKA